MLISRNILTILFALAVLLPVAQGVLYWVGNLLAAMNDAAGAIFAQRMTLALGVFWVLDLVLLVLVLAVNSLSDRDPPQE